MQTRFISLFTLLFVFTIGCKHKNPQNESEPTYNIPVAQMDLANGKVIYERVCAACHQLDGKGIARSFPPLAQSDYLLADPVRALRQTREGLEGPITVNGQSYNGIMPASDLSPQEAVDVTNYILNSWGNKGGSVSKADLP